MKRIFIITIIIILFVFNYILVYKLKQCQQGLLDTSNSIEITKDNYSLSIKLMESYYLEQIKYTDVNLKNFLLKNDNVKISLSDLTKGHDKLVFFAPEKACSPCYDGILEQFRDVIDKVGQENFIVIVPDSKYREFSAYFNNKSTDIQIYSVKSDNTLLEILKGEVPYFCILNNSLIVKQIFIPNKEGVEYFRRYLKIISEKYFN